MQFKKVLAKVIDLMDELERAAITVLPHFDEVVAVNGVKMLWLDDNGYYNVTPFCKHLQGVTFGNGCGGLEYDEALIILNTV